jgi:hypothetical protein
MLRTQGSVIFEKELHIGKEVEHEVCQYFQRKYHQTYVIEGKYSGGDIYIPEVNLLVEVKYDIMSDQTGNYCFEIAHNGNPSGLAVTQSNWWVQVDSREYCLIPTETLKMLIREWRLRAVELISSDNFHKTAYLIKKERLLFSEYVTRHLR